MQHLSDIEIAQQAEPLKIVEIANLAGIDNDYLETYGNYKAKVSLDILNDGSKQNGKLILVTAMTPTSAGEGKTTTTIGLADALKMIGKKVMVALREPSLGPVFGIKGGAAGGGYAQVIPMEDINLHFTGDFHAITAANNLLAALIDNHIHQGNSLGIDTRRITWKRCMDMNDRQLRYITDGLGGKVNGFPREDGFEITAASEIMAVMCLAKDISDLKRRLSEIVIGYNYSGKPVKASDINAQGAMTALLKDALKPNLVQTLEHTPAFVHCGPFANIAHGCNSAVATRMAMKLADYTVTEAGFGADLGAEKFLDIKCRMSGMRPDAVVVVATIRALKLHGGVNKNELELENIDAVIKGLPNLLRHVDNIKSVYGLPCIVAINKFYTDTPREISVLRNELSSKGILSEISDAWASGGAGDIELANKVIQLCEESTHFNFCYENESSIEGKIEAIVRKVYRGDGVIYTPQAKKQLAELTNNGFSNMPVCIAKTQYSFSDDSTRLCAPEGFVVTVRNLKVSAGAGFIVVLTGDIMTMPGLPKVPSAEKIDVSNDGVISGLF